MTTYLDTSGPGGSPLTATSEVYAFGDEVDFYLSVASNLISGQSTGPSVQFKIFSRTQGPSTVNVDYGTTNTTYQVKYAGYLVKAVVPSVGGSVSCRVVITSEPFPLTVEVVKATVSGTASISIDGQTVGVAPAITDAGAAIDPRSIRTLTGTDQVKPLPFATLTEQEKMQEHAIAESTNLTAIVTGVNVINAGSIVQFNVSCSATVAVAAAVEAIQYVVLIGHTSGMPFATAYAGESISGSFTMTTSEKIDISVRNSSAATGANGSAWWAAWLP